VTPRPSRLARVYRGAAAITALAASVYFLLIPALISLHDLRDPALETGQVPRLGWRLFRALTPRYEAWARSRVASGRARQVGTEDIAGTEWPVFGSVFYLWAVESLQEAWEKDQGLARVAPRFFAQGAVDASVALVLDEGHAAWVKRHWGTSYLERGNLFYRALRVAAMTAHLRLTGESRYREQLGQEGARLASEIDASPHGLVEDYPGQCYPADVLVAWAILHRAAAVLGADDGARVLRALRGFAGKHADAHGLPPYACEIGTGAPLGEARGCSNSYLLLVATELWPEEARAWYGRHERFFWQWRHGVAGFREFPADRASGNWYLDVDAGPVIAGHGVAATAFGLGAALSNGRRDHAGPMLAELFAVAWPLPGGTLLLPRLLSNATDAPYLGEAAVLYIVSRQPSASAARAVVAGDGRIPGLVYLAIGGELVLGTLLTASALRLLRRRQAAAPRRS
jgi:hypothetical protein